MQCIKRLSMPTKALAKRALTGEGINEMQRIIILKQIVSRNQD